MPGAQQLPAKQRPDDEPQPADPITAGGRPAPPAALVQLGSVDLPPTLQSRACKQSGLRALQRSTRGVVLAEAQLAHPPTFWLRWLFLVVVSLSIPRVVNQFFSGAPAPPRRRRLLVSAPAPAAAAALLFAGADARARFERGRLAPRDALLVPPQLRRGWPCAARNVVALHRRAAQLGASLALCGHQRPRSAVSVWRARFSAFAARRPRVSHCSRAWASLTSASAAPAASLNARVRTAWAPVCVSES